MTGLLLTAVQKNVKSSNSFFLFVLFHQNSTTKFKKIKNKNQLHFAHEDLTGGDALC